MLPLSTPLTNIRGIGPLLAQKYAKLGLITIKDVLYYFPFRYQDFSQIKNIADLEEGEIATIFGEIKKTTIYRTWKRKMWIVEAVVEDTTGSIKAVWFNQKFMINSLKEGQSVNLSGKISLEGKKLMMQSPEHEVISTNSYEAKHTGRLVPIYSETPGITSRGIRFAIAKIIPLVDDIPEFLPENILSENDLLPLPEALRKIHFPETIDDAKEAERRFAFQDLFLLQLVNLNEKQRLYNQKAHPIPYEPEFIKKLLSFAPFELTLAQKKALFEILEDIKKPHPTNRLLQGDVGSGKTIVSAVAALNVANSDFQTVFMAPTEVLANQHYNTFRKIFDEFDGGIAILTSSRASIYFGKGLETEMTKKNALEEIKRGRVKIIIGTHSVIQKSVLFKDVAFVVIDEQHRFGVDQRRQLINGSTQINTRIESDNKKPGLIFEDLTYKIRGALFNVYNQLGPGHKEIIYYKALIEELQNKKISFDTEKIITVKYNNKKVGTYKPDLVIENKIILELKALPFIGSIEKKQTWTYLKGSNFKLALLVNFGGSELKIERIIFDRDYNYQSKSESNPNRSELLLPHFLSMSATPIPRTMALTVFGDLDLSIINELPKNRKPIITKIVPPDERNDAYEFIGKQIKAGRQAYVICPRIDTTLTTADSTQTYTEKNQPLFSPRKLAMMEVKSVTKEYEKLSKEIFPKLKVEMLHGRLKSKDKQKIMSDFSSGKIDILVATSVIEVGVDVPNSTIMMIEGSEHFGLAQLYQFRGRVGRGEHQSYCFLFTDIKSKTTEIRMKALVSAKSGFELAEIDLKLRGPGQFIGKEQTGLPDLAMKAIQNPQMVKLTREYAQKIIESNPDFSEYPLLANYLKQFIEKVHLE